MDEICERIERAALLHDVGKLVLRANPARMTHAEAGVDFLRRFARPEDEDILRAIGHHHAAALKNLAGRPKNDISYIVYEADNLASGSDRRKDEDGTAGFRADEPLHSIFETFGGERNPGQTGVYPLQGLLENDSMQFPKPAEHTVATAAAYQDVYQYLEANFMKRSPFQMAIPELLHILEATMTYVPSSTACDEVADISLYDHLRLTAAYAVGIYMYLKEKGETDYRDLLFTKHVQEFRKEKVMLLVSGDLSGIQSFIYTIPSKGALKSLRGRSFYLEILMEHLADEILESVGCHRSSLLYTGGGHFYLLLPNTKTVEMMLGTMHQSVNGWMLKNFGTRLYLAMGTAKCAPEDFFAGQTGTRNVFAKVSAKLSEEKLRRYSGGQLAQLFDPESAVNQVIDGGRECAICHTSTPSTQLVPYGETGEEACPMCAGLYRFGERILSRDIFGVSEEALPDALPLPALDDERYLSAVNLHEAEEHGDWQRLYVKNRMDTGEKLMTHVWMGDYVTRDETRKTLEFAGLAARSGGADDAAGINRLGVLRADVDNLGAAFLAGFPGEYATLSRSAVLSRSLALFFKRYINELCKGKLLGEEPFSLFGREKKPERDVHIVYSGGDDVFLVGAWDDLLELSVDLYRAFERFTGGKLHFSAGFGLFGSSSPVSGMARETGLLEDLAKGNPGKNSIALFGRTYSERAGRTEGEAVVFSWPVFIEKVCGEKMRFLQQNFSFEENRPAGARVLLGKSAAYRLMDLLSRREKGINLARFAYMLARMDPGAKAESYEAYQRIRPQLYQWYKDEKDREQLLTALRLMVYSVRE